MELLYKMRLMTEILKDGHKKTWSNEPKKSTLNDVCGIVYRIHCIPENKSYIGQTFSHGYSNKSIIRKGILTRIQQHYNNKSLEQHKSKPLYITLSKYDPSEFEVYEEEKLYGKDISLLNIKEGEYMLKYSSLLPNGYNIEEVGKKNSKLLKDLSELYNFEIKQNNYIDNTRNRRVKDVSPGVFFKIHRISLTKTLELLGTKDVEQVSVTNSNGFRVIVKIRGERDNIRIYFSGTKDQCVEYAKKIKPDIIIKPKFNEGSYKYQLKLDKVIDQKDIINAITFNKYFNNSRKCNTFLVMVYGDKNGRRQTLQRISFGGPKVKDNESLSQIQEFIGKLKEYFEETKIIDNTMSK